MSTRLTRLSCGALALGALLLADCAGPTSAVDGPGSDVRALTGAPTRVVWVQSDGSDPGAEGTRLILMGFDTEDGRGERVILGERGSYHTPMLTPQGNRVVFSTRIIPGPPEIFVVNWDGTGRRKLADGFAMAVWQDPADGGEWVYSGIENTKYDFAKVVRFRIDAPKRRELVWNATMVSMEGFQVTADGHRAGGQWPWPNSGVADLTKKTWKKLGEGCWTSLTDARGPLFWYFDGAHRNVTMVDVDTGARWMVNINNAPGFNGAEVFHPRWTNHPRFLSLTGPYNRGGRNQARTGGPQVEVYLGRFSSDFTKVEAWARVTDNAVGDSHPDAWIDVAHSPYPRRPGGRIGPASVAAARATGGPSVRPDAGQLVLNVRLTRPGSVPTPESILPYRNALVVNEYEILGVVEGAYAERRILIAQWAIRDGRTLAEAHRSAGAAFTLTVQRYDAHAELEGERLIQDDESSGLPLYYDVTKP